MQVTQNFIHKFAPIYSSCNLFLTLTLMNLSIDKSWTLFIDRDGVINRRPGAHYVSSWEKFEFLPGVRKAMALFSNMFGRIVIVTNQQGVGKKMMSVGSLRRIHSAMLREIEKAGGKVDAVYFCPDLEEKQDNCRKPDRFMADKAKNDFPDIDFNKSIMAGDTENDMLFGKNVGMTTVLINTNHFSSPDEMADIVFEDLISFASSLISNDLNK